MCIQASSVRYLLVMLVIHMFFHPVPSTSQPASLILSNIYFNPTPVARLYQLALNSVKLDGIFRHLNGKQNLRPKKGICSYLMKFYPAFDTVFAGYSVYWISNKFLRESFSSYSRGDIFICVTLELGRLIMQFDHNSRREDGNILL